MQSVYEKHKTKDRAMVQVRKGLRIKKDDHEKVAKTHICTTNNC